ncbi:MAG TPA: alpha-L-fucosidase [Opitutaceae bacterium]|nr:alpha-L-fucosidase [Opitutaceae bacterium]
MKPLPRLFTVLLAALPGAIAPLRLAAEPIPENLVPAVIVSTAREPVAPGKFSATWESLRQYETPDWFRDAKFGMWAHWGPQCEPEDGDWYGRNMYFQGSPQNGYHTERYGPPSRIGFKDIIHRWKAENWDPDKLIALYKRAGAQYFFALADHHDNFDLWDSKYQPWNAVRVGPQKDLIGGWAKAARAQGLRFGVSVHASHAWTWYEPSQGSDATGPLAGVPYDGRLTKADGRGQWWDGLDPQDLYAQGHERSYNSRDQGVMHYLWNWGNGASQPDQAYCDKFYNRVMDLINSYDPDLIYFDDDALPLWPVSDAGLKIAAHFYNHSMREHGGRQEGVLFGKSLDEDERHAMTWDIERGHSSRIEPQPWQSDTCIGGWHYKRSIYEQHGYKTTRTVIQALADIVSKNGNLLLNIPVRGDGTIDDQELAVVEGIAAWMDVNRECIFGTRPWTTCGEGPALAASAPVRDQGFNEGLGKPYTGEDVRFTTKGATLYAILLAWPDGGSATLRSLASGSPGLAGRKVTGVALLGGAGAVSWSQDAQGLRVAMPAAPVGDNPVVLRIDGAL